MTDRNALNCGNGRPFPFSSFAALICLTHAATLFAAAGEPTVRFDVMRVISCRDVTPAEFAEKEPQSKFVRAVFEVSSLVHGNEAELAENCYQITVPHRRLQIADYEPRTTGASPYAGNVVVEKRTEAADSLAFSMAGGWKYLAQVTGKGDSTSKDASVVKFEMLPPVESVAASGTLQRGSAVYFKLRRTRQSLLEGSKQFAVTFRAPQAWRADYVHIHCEATRMTSPQVLSAPEVVVCGQGNYLVALYLEGDEESRSVATNFMDTALELGRVAVQRDRDIKRQNFPTVFHQFGAMVGAVEPKISENWLSDIMYMSRSEHLQRVTRQLPPEVRRAAQQYLAARDALCQLGSTR